MKRLLIGSLAVASLAASLALSFAGCGGTSPGSSASPTDTLSEKQMDKLDDQTSIMMLNCQSQLVVNEMGKKDGEKYLTDLALEEFKGKKIPKDVTPIQVQLWNRGYGPDGCEMFHPAFEGEE
jgi:hypothetical protein